VKARAVEQMREIADAIKSCPERENVFEGDCETSHYYSGPPTNLEWDVLPSKTVRSPFQGVIEFTFPARHADIKKTNLPKKQLETCMSREQSRERMRVLLQPSTDVAIAKLERSHPKTHDGHYRLEFDLGSGAPELVKMLWVAKDENDKTITSPVTGGFNPDECWLKTVKSIGGGLRVPAHASTPP
jgi:hypothetical protein